MTRKVEDYSIPHLENNKVIVVIGIDRTIIDPIKGPIKGCVLFVTFSKHELKEPNVDDCYFEGVFDDFLLCEVFILVVRVPTVNLLFLSTTIVVIKS